MKVEKNATLTVSGLTFTRGNAIYGGAIEDMGVVTVSNCTFAGNSATEGGAIYNEFGTVTITGSTFSSDSGSGPYTYGARLQHRRPGRRQQHVQL